MPVSVGSAAEDDTMNEGINTPYTHYRERTLQLRSMFVRYGMFGTSPECG